MATVGWTVICQDGEIVVNDSYHAGILYLKYYNKWTHKKR